MTASCSTMRILAGATLLAAVTLAGCGPKSRSVEIGPGGITTGGAPSTLPQLNGVEREIRDGVLTIGRSAATKTLKRRVAVVIGNSAYQHISRLDNPTNDARAIAALLKQNGFEVVQGSNVGKRSFERLLRQAVLAGGPDADVVAFYAGHGFQIAARNYLVPVDAKLTGANDLPFQTVRLKTLLKILNDRSARHLSFIDSCRNNPFAGQSAKPGVTRSVALTAVGYSAPAVPQGGFVAYATEPGALAYDGEGQPNSPFTAALLRHVRSNPNASVIATLKRVRASVRSATGGQQIPTWTSRLSGSWVFKTRPERVAAISAERAGNPAASAGPTPTVATAPTRPRVSPTTAPTPRIRPRITVDAPMEQVVSVGGRIADKLDLPPTASIKIVRPPADGTVATIGNSATATEAIGKRVSGKNAGALVYIMPPTQKPAEGRIEQNVMTQTIVAEVKLPGKPPAQVLVNLRLRPSNCDFEAGDWLDTQGVRLYRPDRQLSARRAIRACADAVSNDPRNGRFHYLLGKGLEEKGDFQAAVNAYLRAARLGHIRANTALGQIALRVQGAGPISMNYFQIGAAAGDPIAVVALGKLLLDTARLPNEREEAFELLSFGVDLGIPDAMLALADYYASPSSPDHDPERARVFDREAGVRLGETRQRPRPTTRIDEAIDFEGGGGDSDGGSDPKG